MGRLGSHRGPRAGRSGRGRGRELQRRLDRNADTLEEALRSARVDELVQALFQTIQPFPLMFADVLRFFERAGAREGQTQLRLALEGELPGLRHFEEFLEQWRDLQCVIEVPAIDEDEAWLPGEAWDALDDAQPLGRRAHGSEMCGTVDVDAWQLDTTVGPTVCTRQACCPRGCRQVWRMQGAS